jgi:hypothetical protein
MAGKAACLRQVTMVLVLLKKNIVEIYTQAFRVDDTNIAVEASSSTNGKGIECRSR